MRPMICNSITNAGLALLCIWSLSACNHPEKATAGEGNNQPNFLFILSDDQSWQHTSFAGYPLIETPNFDRIAREGVYFSNAFATAPSCTASRSSILAGQPIWRLGSGANLWGEYPSQMISFQKILRQAGYQTGSSGKLWGPGYVPADSPLPTGQAYSNIKRSVPEWIGPVDYPANFDVFLDRLPAGTPFSFWVGSAEPHRPYHPRPVDRFSSADSRRYLPATMPDTRDARLQFSAYLDEIEYFDRDVGRLLAVLEKRGLLENTVVIITSDNGMPFPRGKPNNYDYGVRVPLSIRGSPFVKGGRVVDDFVSLQDIAPSLLDLAGVPIPKAVTGSSLRYALESDRSGVVDPKRDASFTAFERHAGYIRGGDEHLTYPRRAIHTDDFVYIRNYFPERWPLGDPPEYAEAYRTLLVDHKSQQPLEPFFSLAVGKRPSEELFDMTLDPHQLTNLANDPRYLEIKRKLANRLQAELIATNDPLTVLEQDIFQSFKYWGPLPTTKPDTKAQPNLNQRQ